MSDLPKGYDYKPLPWMLTIKQSSIEGIGLFTNKFLDRDVSLGVSHIQMENELVRTPLGGFINHSSTPNCRITNFGRIDKPYSYLVPNENIEEGQELTVDYNKHICGNNKLK